MNAMIIASLIVNILILIPVCAGLITDAAWADEVYGERSPARAILMSVYLAILVVSCALLWWTPPMAVAALLLVQIVYKLITPFAVGSFTHPVVMTNLGVVAFHTVTLVLIWMSLSRATS